jgi:MFS transporter, DHA1 family, multidrug resistance protein
MTVLLRESQKRALFLLFFLIPFLMGMGVDSFVPSLPAISRYFGKTSHETQLTIGLYLLGYAIGQISWGILSDSLGRRKLFILMGGLFVLSSLGAAFSPTLDSLIVCRALQGLCLAGPGGLVRAIATDCFQEMALVKAMSFISISWAMGPIIGPLIGSALQHLFGWKANFIFLASYGLITFGFAALTLKETHLERTPFHFGHLLKTLKGILSHRLFISYTLICTMIYGSSILFNLIAPFLIQVNLHYSVVDYGRIALALGFGYFLGNLLNRSLLPLISPNRLIVIGLTGTFLCALIMVILNLLIAPNLWIVVIPTCLLFCLSSFIFSNVMAACARLFPQTAGTSSALFGSLITAGASLLSSIGTRLPTHSATPMAWMYLGMFVTAIGCYSLSRYWKSASG